MYIDPRLKTSDVGLVTFAALMGAPAVGSEKMVSGNENKLVLETLQRLLVSGMYDTDSGVGWERGGKRGNERVRVKERNVRVGKRVWIAEPADLQEVNISDPTEINKVSC